MMRRSIDARESDFHIDGWHMDPDSEGVLRELFHSKASGT